jgi:hypothetical protein
MNLYQKDGLTILPTIRRNLKNSKNNRTLVKVVQAIKEGRHSPLVNMAQLEQSYAASLTANTILNSSCLVVTRGGKVAEPIATLIKSKETMTKRRRKKKKKKKKKWKKWKRMRKRKKKSWSIALAKLQP